MLKIINPLTRIPKSTHLKLRKSDGFVLNSTIQSFETTNIGMKSLLVNAYLT
jgi:hypothetical protein